MMAPDDWWRDFFQGLTIDCWSKAVPESVTAAEADFICESLSVPAGGAVLDAPCGRGRLALPLAARGLRVTGLDYSVDEIAAARAAAAAKGLTVDWVQGDVRELPWQNQFDGAYCFGNSFGYFDDAGNTRLLHGMHRALKPGGVFVLDAPMTMESLLSNLRVNAWALVGDVYFLGQRRYEPREGRLHVDYTFIKDALVERRTAIYRIYTVRELLKMLEGAGFGDLVLYSSLTREPYSYGSAGPFVVARKIA